LAVRGKFRKRLTITADRQLVTLEPGVIRAGMLRGGYSPVGITREDKPFLRQFPPAGKYAYRYSLTSGKGDWRTTKSYRAGMALSNPLIPVSAVDELSSKSLPPTRSFCSLTAENVVVTALKKAERDNSLVVRVVEMEGAPVRAQFQFLGNASDPRPLNLLEEPTVSTNRASPELRPFEIGTLRLPLKSDSR
jgi:alpha-mannosidase